MNVIQCNNAKYKYVIEYYAIFIITYRKKSMSIDDVLTNLKLKHEFTYLHAI